MGNSSVSIIKSFHYIATPAGMMVLCLLLYALFRLLGWRRLGHNMIALCIAVFLVFATPISARWIEHQFMNYMYPDGLGVGNKQDHDAIIVAGWQQAFLPDNPEMDRFWSDRLWVASRVHQVSGKPIVIISSQFPMPGAPDLGEQPYAVNKLTQWGVAQESIVNAKPGRTTYEAMLHGKNELVRLQAKEVLLVGYALRTARKKQTLESLLNQGQPTGTYKVHLQTTESERNFRLLDPGYLAVWLPNENTLKRSAEIIHEIAGHLGYRLSGLIKGADTK